MTGAEILDIIKTEIGTRLPSYEHLKIHFLLELLLSKVRYEHGMLTIQQLVANLKAINNTRMEAQND